MNLHKIQVEIEAKTKGLKQQLDNAKKQVRQATKEMDESLNGVGGKGALSKVGKTLDNIEAKVKKAFGYKPRLGLDTVEAETKVREYRASIEQLKNQQATTPKFTNTKEFDALERKVERLREAYRNAEIDLERYQSKTNKRWTSEGEEKRILAMKKLDDELGRVILRMEELQNTGAGARLNPEWERLSRSIEKSEKELAKYIAMHRQVKGGTAINGTTKSVRNLIPWLKKGTKGTFDFSRGMRSTYGTGGMLSRMFRTLAISGRFMIASMVWRGVFNGITQGFTDLYNYGGRTAQTLLQLKNALAGLRGSFAAAFAPILNFVAPALNYLIGLLTAAMNAIARFFAVLTGASTYEKASFGAEGFEAAGGAAGGANKKAKEYQKTLLGFDKINKLNEEPDTSGGGGGGGGGTTTEATWTEAIAKSKFADMVKDAWKTGDFEEVGKYVTDQLADALEKIDWAKIKAKAEKIGKSIATFINGACKNIRFWKVLGKTIGEGINTAISFVHGFVTNLDFHAVGVAISTAISEAVKTIDVKKLAETIAAVIKGIPKLLIGMIDGFDYEGVGRKIGEFLGEAIRSIDWVEMAKSSIELLFKALFSLDSWMEGFRNGFWEALLGKEPSIEVGISLIKKGWKSLKEWVGTKVEAAISLIRKGWQSLKQWVGDKVDVAISLLKKGWSTIQKFVGTAVSVSIKLLKSGWSTIKKWLGIDSALGIKFKLPRIGINWGSKTIAGFTIKYPTGFYTYAKGGFPEEGPFMMNRGEIAGKFSNGKGVVANNQQITQGIANAVEPAVYRAMVSALARGGSNGSVTVVLEGDAKGLFKTVQKEANNFMQATGQPAFNL